MFEIKKDPKLQVIQRVIDAFDHAANYLRKIEIRSPKESWKTRKEKEKPEEGKTKRVELSQVMKKKSYSKLKEKRRCNGLLTKQCALCLSMTQLGKPFRKIIS